MNRKQERIAYIYNRLTSLGFDYVEASNLLRLEKTLQRWHELECGDDSGSIERDEQTGKPFFRRQWQGLNGTWHDKKFPYPDKEKGALRRLASLFEKHPDLAFYQQGDPRGCALYVYRKADLPEGKDINALYSSIGLALCV